MEHIEGWVITSGVVLLTWVGSYVSFRTGASKDIFLHTESLKELNKEIRDCVKKEDCGERRNEYGEIQKDIKEAVIRLEQKFDGYIKNGMN